MAGRQEAPAALPQHLIRFTKRTGLVPDPRVYPPSVGSHNLANALAKAEQIIVDKRDRDADKADFAREYGNSSGDAVPLVRRVRKRPVGEPPIASVDATTLQTVIDGLRAIGSDAPTVTATGRTQPTERADIRDLRSLLAQQQRSADRHPTILPLFPRSERKKARNLPGATTRVIELKGGDSLITAIKGMCVSAGIPLNLDRIREAVYLSRMATALDTSSTLYRGEEHVLTERVLRKLFDGEYSAKLNAKIAALVHHSDLLGAIPADKRQSGRDVLLEINRLEGKTDDLHSILSTAPLGKYPRVSEGPRRPGKHVSQDDLPRRSYFGTWRDMFAAARGKTS